MLPNVGYGELLVILVLALLLFGAKQVPEVARNLGRSVNAFKQGLKEGLEEEPSKSISDDKKA
ncbi:MAG TPA: twin-arginine translocase TatA/TatE family subunit [Elusimicrobiota bacterium]|jgi:sec-independent protein translocase protein TatA|nr:twin-arginine translocase TatA/TatE family subunit [Elusimicrobiota bacterium]